MPLESALTGRDVLVAIARQGAGTPGCVPPRPAARTPAQVLPHLDLHAARLCMRSLGNAQLQNALRELCRDTLRVQLLAQGEHAPEAAEADLRVAGLQVLRHLQIGLGVDGQRRRLDM